MTQSDDEQVRGLLADARHTDPMPDDVTARLNDVLAELRTGSTPESARPASAPESGPVDLAVVRRRRNARAWLLAAAAVVVIGVGVNQLDLTSAGDDGDSDSSASSAQDAPGPDVAGGEAAESAPGDSTDDGGEDGLRLAVPALDSDRFGTQVRRLERRAELSVQGGEAGAENLDLAKGCRADAGTDVWGEGRVVSVTYDGSPAVIVLRPVKGDTQVIDLFLCGQEQAERSITLPVG